MKQEKSAVSGARVAIAIDPVSHDSGAIFVRDGLNLVRRLFPTWLVARLAYPLIALPFLLGLVYVYRFGTNLGWEDAFDYMATFLPKWFDGTLTFADLWAQQNEHRLLFSYIAGLAVGLITHWDAVTEMHLEQFFLLAMTAAYLYVFLGTCASRFRGWLFVPIAFLTFSVRQYQPMLMNMSNVQVVAETVAALFCLYLLNWPRWGTAKFLGAAFFAVISSYTMGQGLLVWPVGLVPLVLSPLSKRRKIAWMAAWCAIAAIVFFFYIWGWIHPAANPLPGFSLEYFLTIVGAALFPDLFYATTGGVLLLLLSAAAVVLTLMYGKGRQYSFWLAIMVYGLLVNAQITLGRTGFGPAQGMSSRYVVHSLLTVVGLYAVLCNLNVEKLTRTVSALWGAVLGLVVLGFILSSINGYQIGTLVKQQRDYHVFVFLTADNQPDEALPTAPWEKGPVMRRQIAFLRQHGLNVFHAPDPTPNWTLPAPGLPLLPYPARLQMNPLQVNNEHGQTGLFTFSGIALDGKEDELVGGVFIEVDKVIYPAYYGLPREDVAEVLKTSRVTRCGFRRDFSVSQLGSGRHTLRIGAVSRDRTALYAPTNPVTFEFPALPEAASRTEK